MSWFDCLYRMCCCSICCDQRLSLLQLSDLPVVSKNSRTTWYRWLPPNFYDLLNRIRCSDHWLQVCNHCQGILKLAPKNYLFLKSSISTDHRTVNASMFQSHSKKIPFVLLLLLPSFARTVQISSCHPIFYDLSYCRLRSDSSPDFVFQVIAWQFWPVARGFSTWRWAKETMQRNVVLLSKTIVAQHFKLLTGLLHLCNFKFLSSDQHASRNCRARRSCSDHGEAVRPDTAGWYGDALHQWNRIWRAGWSAAYGLHSTLSRRAGRRIALAAAYTVTVAYRMRQHLFAVQPVICSLKHKPLRCGVPGNRMQ